MSACGCEEDPLIVERVESTAPRLIPGSYRVVSKIIPHQVYRRSPATGGPAFRGIVGVMKCRGAQGHRLHQLERKSV